MDQSPKKLIVAELVSKFPYKICDGYLLHCKIPLALLIKQYSLVIICSFTLLYVTMLNIYSNATKIGSSGNTVET
jgi:hypothetical protein